MLRATAFANSLAVISAVFYVLCRVVVGVAPGLFVAIAESWFHGLVIAPEPWPAMSATSFVLGLVSFAAVAWVFGYAWAWLYKRWNA